MLRTHTCGELNESAAGKTVTLCGWVHGRRDHGSLIFIDIRDGYGITQVVFNPQDDAALHAAAGELRSEFVVRVTGVVENRPAGTQNPRLPTGAVEVHAKELEVLNIGSFVVRERKNTRWTILPSAGRNSVGLTSVYKI